MSEAILKALHSAGGHAHLSQLISLTNMTNDTIRNYLEMLKKDNKVVYYSSSWHLKVFSDKPSSKGGRTTEKILECLTTRRTVADLQCMLPEVKQVHLQETLESLEKSGQVKMFICYKAVHPVSIKPTNAVLPSSIPYKANIQKPVTKQEPAFACQDVRFKEKDNKPQSNGRNNNTNNVRKNNNYNQSDQWNQPQQKNYYNANAEKQPRQPYPQNTQYQPPNSQNPPNRFNSQPLPTDGPFSTYQGPSRNSLQRMPLDDNAPRPMMQQQHMPQQHMQQPRMQQQHMQHNMQQPRMQQPRMQQPVQQPRMYQPMQPPIRSSSFGGIDPYTNQAYGCSLSGCQNIPSPNIRTPAPIRPTGDRTSTGRGRNKSKPNRTGKPVNPDTGVSYSKERKTTAYVRKEPDEDIVKEQMRRDSGLSSNGNCNTSGKAKDKVDDKSKAKDKVDDKSKDKDKVDDKSKDSSTRYSSEGMTKLVVQKDPEGTVKVTTNESTKSRSDSGNSDRDLNPKVQTIPDNLATPPANTQTITQILKREPLLQHESSTFSTILELQQISNELSQSSLDNSRDLASFDDVQTDMAQLSLADLTQPPSADLTDISQSPAPCVDITQSPAPLVDITQPSAPCVDISQPAIAEYNFGLSDSDLDSDDEIAPLSAMLTPQPQVRSPPPQLPHTTTTSTKKVKITKLLGPIVQLCKDNLYTQPVLLLRHSPKDIIAPWYCELTVEQTFSATGEGASQHEAVSLAVNTLRDIIASPRTCRQYKQQTDPLARMLYLLCYKSKLHPPIYNCILTANSRITISATIFSGVLLCVKGAESMDAALTECIEKCCRKMGVPVPGMPAWIQDQIDYKLCLEESYPSVQFATNRIGEEWWCEAVVGDVSYKSMRPYSMKWLSIQSAACFACLELHLPAFYWDEARPDFMR